MNRSGSIFNLIIICLLVGYHSVVINCKWISEDHQSLQLVHILFRHGDRTNTDFGMYPKDPYINETYSPYGKGELTKKGKQTEYNLGKEIRKRYDKLLGKTYSPALLEAWSSNTNRTKTSLMLLLAALFKPTPEEVFEDGLPWQPVPFNLPPVKNDKIFFGMLNCPRFKEEYIKHVESEEMKETFKKYEELFQYLSENTGWNVTNFEYIFKLYIGLKLEEEWGLELPSWTKKIYPQPIEELAPRLYMSLTATNAMKRIMLGYLLQKIIHDTQSKINNEEYMREKKLILYSGHEFNIGALLTSLDLFDSPHIPPYGSYVAFEFHNINNVEGFKIFYQKHATSDGEPQLLTLPGCESFCEFDKFVSLLKEDLPDRDSCEAEVKRS